MKLVHRTFSVGSRTPAQFILNQFSSICVLENIPLLRKYELKVTLQIRNLKKSTQVFDFSTFTK